MSQFFIIPYKVYPFDVIVSIGDCDKDIIRTLKKRGMMSGFEILHMPGDGRTVIFENGQTVIRLRHAPTDPKTFNSLSHEIFHAVYFLMQNIGITLTYESNEAFAYLTGYLTEQILTRLKTDNNAHF